MWPELVGKNGEEAKQIILRENHVVKWVFIYKQDALYFADFCCNRVHIFVDKNGKVSSYPHIPMVG
ncbi:hypothetical protein ACJIZ3_019743 [Penstemon smallii]|uniref:Uncharacterized protein n=1 Tax=Penstemon smallii TaxID=265156 RepID=A0ABD3T2T4_9LAMI